MVAAVSSMNTGILARIVGHKRAELAGLSKVAFVLTRG
jgi:hypothetical protein